MGIYFYIQAFVIGIWAALFTGTLSRPGEMFGWVPALYKWLVRNPADEYPQGWRAVLAKPVYECGICHAGQVALWGYLLLYPYTWAFFDHFSFVVLAMAGAATMQRIWN